MSQEHYLAQLLKEHNTPPPTHGTIDMARSIIDMAWSVADIARGMVEMARSAPNDDNATNTTQPLSKWW